VTTHGGSAAVRRPVVLGPGEGRAYPMGRLSAVFNADGAETRQMYSISEWWLDPHTKGPGPHSNPKDEAFYVLAGTLSLLVDTEWVEANSGSFVLVPGDVTHDFENRTSEVAGMLHVSAPGDFEPRMAGISQWFLEGALRDTRDEAWMPLKLRPSEKLRGTPDRWALVPVRLQAT
jgi:mannose-6-phosphate isomerase-like protein (cupin superfamily)